MRIEQKDRTLPALYCVTGVCVSVVGFSVGDFRSTYLYVVCAFCRSCLYRMFDESWER